MADDPLLALDTATESLPSTIFQKVQDNGGMWSNAITRGSYDLGKGYTKTKQIIERLEPVDDDDIGTTVSSSNVGDLTYEQHTPGYTEFTHGPKVIPLKGPLLNRNKLTFDHEFDQFVRGYENKLGQLADKKFSLAMRYNYVSLANLMIARDDPSLEITAAGASWPTSTDATPEYEASFDLMDLLAQELIDRHSGEAVDGHTIVSGDYGPVWPCEIGIGMLQKMKFNDPDRREDLRAVESSELFKRLGATSALGNFRYVPTSSPLRFKLNAGALEVVPAWVSSAASGGKKAVRNPDWKDPSIATFEAIIPFSPHVFEAEMIPILSGAGSTVRFDPKSNMGRWAFVRDGHKLNITLSGEGNDPFMDWGQHFGEFWYSPAPKAPDQGFMLLVKRDTASTSYVEV